jgi:glycerophosphoryl diester phosphodiesterase
VISRATKSRRRKDDVRQPVGRPREALIIAHRGHSIAVPENTLEAYRRAIELGVEMIECDVNRTKDGELVMIHDWTLDRTTSGSGRVEDMTLSEIRDLDAGSSFDPSFAGLRVPTTAETLDLAREAGILMCFEVKGETPAHFRRVAEQLVDSSSRRTRWAGHSCPATTTRRWRPPRPRCRNSCWRPSACRTTSPSTCPRLSVRPKPSVPRSSRTIGAMSRVNYLTRSTSATSRSWTWPTTEDEGIIRSLDAGVDGVMGDDVSAMVRLVGERFGSPA